MAPLSANTTEETDLFENPKSISNRQEILFDGYYYDVTDFISRHPGGNIISYYTAKGEDATQAIQQFHHRSIKKVQAIMKSFPKRIATDVDVAVDSKQLAKHQELSKDFADLFLQVQREGLFEPSYWHIASRIFEIVLMTYISGICLFSQNIVARMLSPVIYGLAAGRAGFLGHECGHNSLTGNTKLDKFMHSIIYGLFIGLSSNQWNRNHNRHHAMPQRLKHDVDLDTMPFVAYNSKVISDPKQGRSFWIQNQMWLFVSINSLLGTMAWRCYHSPLNAFKRRNYMDLFFMALHWHFVLKYHSILNVLIGSWVSSQYMYSNFALSHTHTPIAEASTHWVEYSLTHTIDVSHNIFVDWWMGWLNYQIEHHLFPTMPHFRARRVAERVKALAEKHGLPYRRPTYKQAWAMTLKNLSDISKEFADPAKKVV